VTTALAAGPFVIQPGGGLDAPLARLGTVHKIPSRVIDGRLAIVEHTLPPRHLAAPRHRHSREDELSIVLEGTLGVLLGDTVITAGPGAYVLKPRGQWHTFWNAGDTELRLIELLTPGGFDGYYARLSPLLEAAAAPDPAAIQNMAAEYGVEFDFDGVAAFCQRFGLRFE